MNNNFFLEEIDFSLIIRRILKEWKIASLVMVGTFILACGYVLSIPRFYMTQTEMAPEIGRATLNTGSLGSIAESLGVNLNDAKTTDAINPLLYPKLLNDNRFVAGLLTISLTDKDGKRFSSYADYLANHQKSPWWSKVVGLLKSKEKNIDEKKSKNPYIVGKKEFSIFKQARANLSISIDKLSGIITITAKAQDPYISMELADSVRQHLQNFITEYRTSKARVDYEYYTKLAADAKQKYEKARRLYGSTADTNADIVLESYRAKINDLENDMQLKYNTYTTFLAQQQNALAKVQERTPAFTVIQGAALPIKPAGPKRMLIVLGWLFIAFIGFCSHIIYKIYKEQI